MGCFSNHIWRDRNGRIRNGRVRTDVEMIKSLVQDVQGRVTAKKKFRNSSQNRIYKIKKKKKTLIIKKERNRISSQNRILAAFGESLWMC